MSDTILHLVEHFGYAAVGLLIFAEGLGLPLPGELSLLVGAAVAASTGRLSLTGILVAASAGAILGAAGGYAIGASVSDARLLRWADRVGLGAARFRRAQEIVRAHGVRTALFGRFIAVARMLVGVLAGASRMPFPQFLLFSSVGALLWTAVYGTVGYLFGENLPLLERRLGRTSLAVLLAIVLTASLIYLARRRRAREAAE